MGLTISEQIDKFVSSYVDAANESGLKVAYEANWPSPCLEQTATIGALAPSEGEMVSWAPKMQNRTQDETQGRMQERQNSFANVENAMSLSLHPDFCEFFTRYYSANFTATAEQGQCELLQVWNDEDFEGLQQNLIGHLLMKQRLKQAPTLFFGLTDEEDFILSIINDTGEVALEQVGKEPQQIVAPNLAAFLASLTPTPT
ncbi:MAG: SecY-interacting protein [Pseudomonadota bacterium]|jgi:SecY interacting protein Syd|nr:SecY-interacting protein [Pseudomonadota bacterium]